MRRTEDIAMYSGEIEENVYANSFDGRRRTELRKHNTDPPATGKPQGWMIITLVVLLILTFIILIIFTSLLYVFYRSITEEQSHLKTNVEELTARLDHHTEETDSVLKKNVPDLQKSVADIMDDLRKTKSRGDIQKTSCTSCPPGWKLIRSNCYYFRNQKEETWERSREECGKLNGFLLILEDREELIQDSLFPVKEVNQERYWIGLRRDKTNIDRWLWVDGSALTFSAWNLGEPNNDGNNEHCAEILGSGRSWNDLPCDIKIGYICKNKWTC